MSKEKQEKESSGFKVSDRRSFTAEGELRQDAEQPTEESKQTAAESSRKERPQQTPPDNRSTTSETPHILEGQQTAPGLDEAAGEVTFASFLMSLATTAMVNLGAMPDPGTGTRHENLEAAKQMIDILALLKDKTEGNLDAEEEQILEQILYELRMHYVNKSKVSNRP